MSPFKLLWTRLLVSTLPFSAVCLRVFLKEKWGHDNECSKSAALEGPWFEKLMHEAIGELRCPRCADDITVCPCSPGQNRAMYNISRAFRTAESQRLLPILRHRFGEQTVRQASQQTDSYAAPSNWSEPSTTLLYDIDPPTHESAVVKSRRQCEAIVGQIRRRGTLFDQSDELGRVQWSALHIIGSFLTFDNVSNFMHSRHQNLLEPQKTSNNPRMLGHPGLLGIYNVLLPRIAA